MNTAFAIAATIAIAGLTCVLPLYIHWLAQAASRGYFEEKLRYHLKLFEYRPTDKAGE